MSSKKPDFNRAFKRTFWQIYDNMFCFFALSILWLIFSITVIFAPAATASLFQISHLASRGKHIKIRYFFKLILEHFIKSTFLSVIFTIAFIVLIFNLQFYISHFKLFGIILSGICFWLLFFLLLSSCYIFPLLTRKKSIKRILLYSFFLVINNFVVSLTFLITNIFLFCIEIVLPIIGISILAVFSQNVFLEIESLYNPNISIKEPKRNFAELVRPWAFPQRHK